PALRSQVTPALRGSPGRGQVLAGERDLARPMRHRRGADLCRLRIALGGGLAIAPLQGDLGHDGQGGGIGRGGRLPFRLGGAACRKRQGEGGKENAQGMSQGTHTHHYRASPPGAHGPTMAIVHWKKSPAALFRTSPSFPPAKGATFAGWGVRMAVLKGSQT